jgi:FkbM family methyltransferase
MTIEIKKSQGGSIFIPTTKGSHARHFSERSNCSLEILDQLKNKIYGFYFKPDTRVGVVLDLGANVGLFSLHVSDSSDKIFAVEPTPSHYEILEDITESFGNIECLNYAVNDADEDVEFFLTASNSTTNSLIDREGNKNSIKVKGRRLDTIVSSILNRGYGKIDFCKIDIEGSEDSAISESIVRNVKDKVDNFFIEFHEVNGKNFADMERQFSDIFSKNGYEVKKTGIDSIFASK